MTTTEYRTFLKFKFRNVAEAQEHDIWINPEDISHFVKHFEHGTMMYLRGGSAFHLVDSIEAVVAETTTKRVHP